ncbi:hypothetical protein HRbin05_00402 [archaeon HR05]|nr:hypothetical protein HRbin05_00402 [archaeon HR05]
MRSPKSTSSIEPTEMNALNPIFSFTAQSTIAEPRAPLWEMKATFPGFGVLLRNVALRLLLGLIMPRQFGPIMFRAYLSLASIIFASNALPSSPTSLNPAEIMMRFFTPALPHCSTIPGTVGAGVAITARSTLSGISSTLL